MPAKGHELVTAGIFEVVKCPDHTPNDWYKRDAGLWDTCQRFLSALHVLGGFS